MMNYLKEKGWKKIEISKTEKKTVSRSEVKALFNYIDKDRSGFISLEVCVFSFHLIFILLSLIVKHVLTCPEICQWWIMMRVVMRMWHRTWGVSDASSIELLKESVQFIYNFSGSQECPIVDSGPLWNDRGRKWLSEADHSFSSVHWHCNLALFTSDRWVDVRAWCGQQREGQLRRVQQESRETDKYCQLILRFYIYFKMLTK